MTKKIIYVAYNGMEFEDEKECKEYEQYAVDMATQLMESYAFFDKYEKCFMHVALNCFDNFEDFCEWFEDTYNDCEAIEKIKDCPDSATAWTRNEFGFYMPEGVNGTYKFNFNAGAWLLESKMV